MTNFISLFALSITFLILLIILGIKRYYIENKQKFSFFKMFPFELFVIKNKLSLFFKIVFLIPIFLLLAAGINIFLLDIGIMYFTQVCFAFALIVLGAFCFLVLYFIKPDNLKIYLMFFVLLLVSSVMLYAINGVMGIMSIFDKGNLEIDIKKIIVGSISVLFFVIYCIFIFICIKKPLFNMDKINNEDGTLSYVRPKRFPVAYMQWLSLISLFINTLLLFLLFI